MSFMFNHGVEMGHRGDLSTFTHLLAEAIFKSIQVYEDALEYSFAQRWRSDRFGDSDWTVVAHAANRFASILL
jgi:hypothetical protein